MGIKGKNDKMVVLACEDCKERNYTTTKNKKTIKESMELKKYRSRCKKHTVQKETKSSFILCKIYLCIRYIKHLYDSLIKLV